MDTEDLIARDGKHESGNAMKAALMHSLNNGKSVGDSLWLWCPGCNEAHKVNVRAADGACEEPCWEWDGNIDAPTISPSLLVTYTTQGATTCHSFVVAGQWQFLNDSSHALAGQTVPLPELPDWLRP